MLSCIFCGSQEATEKIVFPETFTAYQLLQAGDKACMRCASMFKDPKFRRNSWVMQGDDWMRIDDVLGFLSDMPEPPFVLYLTLQKRKHGWILAVQNPVLNLERFILCVDEEKIFFNRPEFNELISFLESLWPKKLPKVILKGGYPPAGLIRKYMLTRLECQKLESLKSNRMWHFIVDFKRRDENV